MEAVTAAMQQLISSYGEGPVYAAAGGAAVFCALKLSLPGGGAGKPSQGLTLDPALEYKCKEVANPGTKGWGYSGVRFERCEDDDMTVKLVGDRHYPDISVRSLARCPTRRLRAASCIAAADIALPLPQGKRIPHFIAFALEMCEITKAQFDAPLQTPSLSSLIPKGTTVPSAALAALENVLGKANCVVLRIWPLFDHFSPSTGGSSVAWTDQSGRLT